MAAPYRRELRAKSALEQHDIRCFVPMRMSAVRHRDGNISTELIPAVHNLIFVYSTKDLLQQVKQEIPFIQYLTRREKDRNVPITVPEADMQRFISVTETYNSEITFVKPEDIRLEKGTPVKVLGGPFDGTEGIFVKVKGLRNRRVVIMVKNLLGAAIEVKPDLLQVLKRQNKPTY